MVPPEQTVVIGPVPPGLDSNALRSVIEPLVRAGFVSCSGEVKGKAFVNFASSDAAAAVVAILNGKTIWGKPISASLKAAAPGKPAAHAPGGKAVAAAMPASAAPVASVPPSAASTSTRAPPTATLVPEEQTVVISPVPTTTDAQGVRSLVIRELRASGVKLMSCSDARSGRAYLNFSSPADAAAAARQLHGTAPWGQALNASLKAASRAAGGDHGSRAAAAANRLPVPRCPLARCLAADCPLRHPSHPLRTSCAAGAACSAPLCMLLHPIGKQEKLLRDALATQHRWAAVPALNARAQHLEVIATARRAEAGLLAAPVKNEEAEQRKGVLAAARAKVEELLQQLGAFDDTMNALFSSPLLQQQQQDQKAKHQLSHRVQRECYRLKAALPALALRSELERAVAGAASVVVKGATGSGKSTQVVQYLAEMPQLAGGRVVCTQPRKVAAESLARRVAEEWACGKAERAQVGGAVGFATGGRAMVSRWTRIEYVTEGVLLARLRGAVVDDEAGRRRAPFEGVSVVVLDEAHERSLTLDILLGVLRAGQRDGRWPHLKLVVTSATINTDLFATYLGAARAPTPLLQIPGRMYPVEVRYRPLADADLGESDRYAAEAVNTALAIHLNTPADSGDVLVFLTGRDEVEWAAEELKRRRPARACIVATLYGKQQPEEQAVAFAKPPAGERKIIFATDVAETSLTIDGVRHVVDCGLAKESLFDPRRNVTVLEVRPISRSSAEQRKGRAGRTAPGTCYRLYSADDLAAMAESQTAEVLSRPLELTVVTLVALGIDPSNFAWLEEPDKESRESSTKELCYLGALQHAGGPYTLTCGCCIFLSLSPNPLLTVLSES